MKLIWKRHPEVAEGWVAHLLGDQAITLFIIEPDGPKWKLLGAFVPDELEREKRWPELKLAKQVASNCLEIWMQRLWLRAPSITKTKELQGYSRCRCGNPVDGDHVTVKRMGIGGDEYDEIECQGCQRRVVQMTNVKPTPQEIWNFMQKKGGAK